MPDLLHFGVTLDRPELSGNGGPSELRCHLEVRASPTLGSAAAGTKTQTAICLVLDCSSSMSGPKVEAAIDAAKSIVDLIDDRHAISLVIFHWRARVVVAADAAKTTSREAL